MKKLYIILLLLHFSFLYVISYSQIFKNENCGYNEFVSSYNTKSFNKFLSEFKTPNNVKYAVPVKFLVIRSDNGKSRVNYAYLKELIQYLNYYYSVNNTGISFYLRPDIQFIDKTKLLKLRYYKQSPFTGMKYKTKECLNVLITNQLLKHKFLKSGYKKYAGTYNPFARLVIISYGSSTSTLSHETGHFLGLKHPHRGWKHKWFQEPVSRMKKMPLSKKRMCEKKGDKLCDTPAEPNLTKYTDKNCNYTGWNVTDKYGEVYKPDTHNIMSYTNNRECRNKFTKQQITLMHYTLSKMKYSEFWKTDLPENKKYLPDVFEPDNYENTATEIFFNTPQTHTFNIYKTISEKENISDDVDWVYFNLDSERKQNVRILIDNIDIKQSFEIKTEVFFEKKLIYSKETNRSLSIDLNNLKKGRYYIKITNAESRKKYNSYTIEVAK